MQPRPYGGLHSDALLPTPSTALIPTSSLSALLGTTTIDPMRPPADVHALDVAAIALSSICPGAPIVIVEPRV